MALDANYIYFYGDLPISLIADKLVKKHLSGKLAQLLIKKEPLKSGLPVSQILPMDPYNEESESYWIRYLVATEGGELFLLAFKRRAVKDLADSKYLINAL